METLTNIPFIEISVVFSRYVRRQGDRLNPDGVYCKQNAIQLKYSLEKRVSSPSTYRLAKVQKSTPEGPNLLHKSGGIYNYHYLVVADCSGIEYALDPYLYSVIPEPITVDEYIGSAYNNPQDVVWGTPQI